MGASRICVGVLAVGLAAGCGSSGSTDVNTAATTPRADIAGLVEPACLAGNLLAGAGLVSEAPPAPQPTAIPPDFEPVRVVTCERSDSTDANVTWIEQHRQDDLTAVLAGYELPTDALRTTQINGVDVRTCRVDQMTPPIVWLVDAQGLAMRPALPTGGCGEYKWDAITAIHALPVTQTIGHLIPVAAPPP